MLGAGPTELDAVFITHALSLLALVDRTICDRLMQTGAMQKSQSHFRRNKSQNITTGKNAVVALTENIGFVDAATSITARARAQHLSPSEKAAVLPKTSLYIGAWLWKTQFSSKNYVGVQNHEQSF